MSLDKDLDGFVQATFGVKDNLRKGWTIMAKQGPEQIIECLSRKGERKFTFSKNRYQLRYIQDLNPNIHIISLKKNWPGQVGASGI